MRFKCNTPHLLLTFDLHETASICVATPSRLAVTTRVAGTKPYQPSSVKCGIRCAGKHSLTSYDSAGVMYSGGWALFCTARAKHIPVHHPVAQPPSATSRNPASYLLIAVQLGWCDQDNATDPASIRSDCDQSHILLHSPCMSADLHC